MEKVWAFDLGASNGRLMVSGFDGKRLYLEEVHGSPIALFTQQVIIIGIF